MKCPACGEDDDYCDNIIHTRQESIEATADWYKRLGAVFKHGMGCGMIKCAECPMSIPEDNRCGVGELRRIFLSMKGLK